MATASEVLAGKARWSCDVADCRAWLATLPDGCVHCAITSPPYYGLRDYGVAGQLGLEKTPAEYVEGMVGVFREVRRVLHPSGLLWLNLGDSYAGGGGGNYTRGTRNNSGQNITNVRNRDDWLEAAGAKPKDLLGIPWRVAFGLQSDGWYLRQWMPWVKRSPMPESATDRPGTACEVVFLLAKSDRYFFDMEAVKRGAVMTPQRRTSPKSVQRKGGTPGQPPHNGSLHLRDEPEQESDSRNFRSADLWFDSVGMLLAGEDADDLELLGLDVTSTPYKHAHFATFPPKLVRPLVLAGTSERGVCPDCGAPWKRMVKKERQPTRPGCGTKCTVEAMADHGPGGMANRDPERHCTATKTVGWEPGCSCGNPDVVPSVVLDPFAGSGVTLAVAVDLGRRAVGCELNPQYVKFVNRRLSVVTPDLF